MVPSPFRSEVGKKSKTKYKRNSWHRKISLAIYTKGGNGEGHRKIIQSLTESRHGSRRMKSEEEW